MLKLKDNVKFEELKNYGFVEDDVNCEHPEDRYYFLNNYYYQEDESFRITVNINSRVIEILCLAKEACLHNTRNIDVLYDLFADGLIVKV